MGKGSASLASCTIVSLLNRTTKTSQESPLTPRTMSLSAPRSGNEGGHLRQPRGRQPQQHYIYEGVQAVYVGHLSA